MKNNPEKEKIKKLMKEGDRRSNKGRLERLRFLIEKEKEPYFPAPALAVEYYEEARLCWYMGAFVATILMTQLAFEELLRSHYRAAKGVGGRLDSGKKVDDVSFSDLIEEARVDKWITKEEAKLLHSLRKNARNPYVHVKDIKINENGKPNLKKANFFTQYLKIGAPEVIGYAVSNEAKKAISLLVKLLPSISIRFGGL